VGSGVVLAGHRAASSADADAESDCAAGMEHDSTD
jgi:hypothetical protein